MNSVMNHSFARVPSAEIQRASFDRTHGYKTTLNAGYLVPIFVDEALPGDTFNVRMTAFARLATPLKPFMDNMFIESFFFSVPYRLVWDKWVNFNGEQKNPADPTDFLVPQLVMPAGTGADVGSVADYMGIPTGIASLSVSALPFRAINLIWNNWFRDQNLQNSVNVSTGDGPDTYADYTLLRRGKRHDYFSSCLPWPQKGPAIQLPLGETAPVNRVTNAPNPWVAFGLGNNTPAGAGAMATSVSGTIESPAGQARSLDPNGGLYADLSSASAASINELREAFQLQRLYERDARGGSRYPEILKSHFGVRDPQFDVLQRPEYLGGGSSPVNISPVAQTSGSPGTGAYTDTPQGNLAALGTASMSGHGFTKSFTEHCIIIGFVNVRADLTYQQGLNRMWSRRTRWDFYWPSLAHLGEQAVLNKEIYAQGTAADDSVFGYQERYAEYRYKPSIITGQFRSSYAQSLDFWHLATDFTALPALNASFIEDNPPVDRVIAVPTEPHFLFDGYFKMKCARPMPVYGVPGYIDHF